MKKIYLNLLIGSIILLGACNKTSLDLVPVSSVSDASYWKTADQFETFITGIHSRLRTHQWTLFILGTLRADEFGDNPFGGESSGGYERYWLNTLNSENTGISSFGGFYTNINQINLFIAKTVPSTILPVKDKNYMLGQAYGLRAFYYFHLLRTWGDVVLSKDPNTSFDLDKLAMPASPASEVMKLIKEDIENSVASFGDDYSFKLNSKAFWSKAASLMLKSEVFLWSAKQMGGGVADASIAKTTLTEIQTRIPTSGLMANFKDVFAYSQKNNKEILFSIGNAMNEYNIFGGNQLEVMMPQITYIGNYYDSLLNRKFDKSIDIVQQTGSGMAIALKIASYYRFSQLDSRKFESIQGAYNLINGSYVLAGCYLKKYQGVMDAGKRYWVNDFPVYRYADLLLMLAEVKSMLGEDPANEINLVRQRAYRTNYQPAIQGYPNQQGDSDINETILKERSLEFIAEGKRWYDLRRFGTTYLFKYTTAKQEYQLLWPIDKTALTNNKALVQTTGY